MIDLKILNRLNAPTAAERLAELRAILPETRFPPMVPQYINNHSHTTYSFSPYSPTAALYAARMEGLCTAGIIDHDSISGAEEFLAAAELAGRYGVEFLYRDFRPGFRQGQVKARELGLYMQKYCGCVFSEEERYAKQIARDKEKF